MVGGNRVGVGVEGGTVRQGLLEAERTRAEGAKTL